MNESGKKKIGGLIDFGGWQGWDPPLKMAANVVCKANEEKITVWKDIITWHGYRLSLFLHNSSLMEPIDKKPPSKYKY